jgi:hypothetical protein
MTELLIALGSAIAGLLMGVYLAWVWYRITDGEWD